MLIRKTFDTYNYIVVFVMNILPSPSITGIVIQIRPFNRTFATKLQDFALYVYTFISTTLHL